MTPMIMALAAAALSAAGQTAPAPAQSTSSSDAPAAAAAGQAKPYTTTDTEIAVILADPAAKAVMARHLPRITADERIGQAGSLTLAQLQQFSPEVTPEVLAAIDADFAKLAKTR